VAAYVFTALALLGISFLFYCLSVFSAKIRHHSICKQATFEDTNKLLLWWNSRQLSFLLSTFGVLFCAVIAALLCVFFQASSFREVLPIWFLIVIAGIAIRFGFLAGLLGTILASSIFAAFLFEPLRSLSVQGQAGRNSLIWMVLGGLALAELLGNSPKSGKAGKT
jgi:K+-sensing histidine kinase KdpD